MGLKKYESALFRILHSTTDFNDALKKLKEAEYTSDLGEPRSERKRKKKNNRREYRHHRISSSSSEEDADSYPDPPAAAAAAAAAVDEVRINSLFFTTEY